MRRAWGHCFWKYKFSYGGLGWRELGGEANYVLKNSCVLTRLTRSGESGESLQTATETRRGAELKGGTSPGFPKSQFYLEQ